MPKNTSHILPTWAPRVSRPQIAKFYRSCGLGLVDEEIIDDIGFALYARCQSILTVMESMRGNVTCPNCETVIKRVRLGFNETLQCPECSWERDWNDYKNSFDGKFLNAGGMKPFCIEYEQAFRTARTPEEKMILIDTLIHRCHGEMTGGKQPGAYAFIEGEPYDTAVFLDRLNYGDLVPEHIKAKRESWRERVAAGPRFWSDQVDRSSDTEAESE